MTPAQQRAVLEVGGAAEQPVDEVVHVAPGGRCSAARELTVLIAQHDRPSEPPRDGAGAAAEVEHLAVGVHDEPRDRAVAHETFSGDARDGSEAGDLALESVELDQRTAVQQVVRHDELGTGDRSRGGQLAATEA